MMRKHVGWLVAWALFWMGDAAARPLRFDPWEIMPQWYFDFFYRIYNWLMSAPSDVQDWGGAGPWSPMEPLGEGNQ